MSIAQSKLKYVEKQRNPRQFAYFTYSTTKSRLGSQSLAPGRTTFFQNYLMESLPSLPFSNIL